MKNRSVVSTLVTAFTIVFVLGTGVAFAETYTMLAPVTKGMEGGSFEGLMNDVAETMAAETGLDVKFETVVYDIGENDAAMLIEPLKNGEADLTLIGSTNYLLMEKELNKYFIPAFTIVFNNSKYADECLWVLEDSKFKTVEDLRGATWGNSVIYPTRTILYDNGIDEPVDKFFGKTIFNEDAPLTNSVQALGSGKIDVFAANRHHLAIGGGGSVPGTGGKDAKPVKYRDLVCMEGELHWTFGFNKDVPEDVRTKITKLFVTAHKNKAFQKFQFMFMAIKGGFARIEDGDYDRTREIVKLIKDGGWDKEQEAHFAKRKK